MITQMLRPVIFKIPKIIRINYVFDPQTEASVDAAVAVLNNCIIMFNICIGIA